MSDFNSRLNTARKKAGLDKPPSGPIPPISLASYALRVATELIAGIIVGGLIGWWVDHQFKTSPWGLIGFLLLGTAAGILNLVRMVQRVNAQLGAGSGPADATPDDDDEK
jgi:ATP synthase protein I